MTRMHLPQVLADAKTVQCVAERSALVAWFVICIADNKNARGKRRDGCSPRVVSFITVSSKLVSVVAQVLVCANMKYQVHFIAFLRILVVELFGLSQLQVKRQGLVHQMISLHAICSI